MRARRPTLVVVALLALAACERPLPFARDTSTVVLPAAGMLGGVDPATVWAWVLNGDEHSHHVGNVDRAVTRLIDVGVPPTQIVVASAGRRPDRRIPRINFGVADARTMRVQQALLASRMGPGDTFVVYLTGHGGSRKRGPRTNTWVALHRSYPFEAVDLLAFVRDEVTARRVVLVSDTCFGGGFVKTLDGLGLERSYSGASPTDEAHKTYCQPFAPRFWSVSEGFDAHSWHGSFEFATKGCQAFQRNGRCRHGGYGCESYTHRRTFLHRDGA